MDTSPLKTFATAARVQLLREVSARLSVVLAPSSIARVEALGAVNALERAIAEEGGGDIGQKAVIDRVAYMWFNRVVALRFMDSNGYTGTGVVSPDERYPNAQPEILTQAKLGQIDPDLLDAKLLTRVSGLLNGTIRSEDSQNEAYGILLMAYCRLWNKSMPFIFEKEGDFTELLIPGNLLSDESVIAKALEILTPEVCKDVEVIGWLYQFYISERKDEVFAGFKKNHKAGPGEIPAATQLFTPDWIVRYLVENSLGRLWLLNRPDSKLADQMEFYIPPNEIESEFLQIVSPLDIKVMDPACGSGHMLTYAFDLLYAIYEEEGYSPPEIPILILENNLFGIEIDPRAGALASFALTMKGRARLRTFFAYNLVPRICVLEPISFTSNELLEVVRPVGNCSEEEGFLNQFVDADTFGSLITPNEAIISTIEGYLATIDVNTLSGQSISDRTKRVIRQATFLSRGYNVVVANPPYMGSGNMSPLLAEFVKQSFPNSKADLFSAFIERGFTLIVPKGYSAMVVMQSWMFLTSFEKLREDLSSRRSLECLLHMGNMVMGIAFGTSAVVWKSLPSGEKKSSFMYVEMKDMFEGRPKSFPIRSQRMVNASVSDFEKIAGKPIIYWFPKEVFSLFEKKHDAATISRAAIGMVTGNNAKYVREWFEVSMSKISFDQGDLNGSLKSDKKWFPYAKGGKFRRWAGNYESVVNWENGGIELQTARTPDGSRVQAHNFNLDRIFKKGFTWTAVTNGSPSFRIVNEGFLFDAAAGICQAHAGSDLYLLGLLNSSSARFLLEGLNPTINLSPGYLGAVPVPVDNEQLLVEENVARAIAISLEDWNASELSWDFRRSPLLGRAGTLAEACNETQHIWNSMTHELGELESQNNVHFSNLFNLSGLISDEVPQESISLDVNPAFRYKSGLGSTALEVLQRKDMMVDFISYAIGCSFGRFSIDGPGVISGNQDATAKDYLGYATNPLLSSDTDIVIPVIDGDWFEDDIVSLFRKFLRFTFGGENFHENLRFIEECLGKDLRKYFIADFYKDHVQRYKKRPIYWLFSSSQGSFNALIYMHGYDPSTASIVLNEYLREFEAKLRAELVNQEGISANSANPREKAHSEKETDRIRKVLLELNEYEHDVLYPLATQQLSIDLDDGVKVNYLKFGSALKSIPGLGASDE